MNMATSAEELYTQAVRHLAPKERLQLAALILEELARSSDAIEFSDAWSEQDQRDLAAFALGNATSLYERDEETT